MASSPAQTITIKKAYEDLAEWNMQAPYTNKYTRKQESAMLYKGEVVAVQAGTPKQPIYCHSGVTRWSKPHNHYIPIEPEDTQWATQSATDPKRAPSGKAQAEFTLYEYDQEGTQGFYTYHFLTGIVERIVQNLVHGIPDPNQPGASLQIMDLKTPNNTDSERETIIRSAITTPVREPNGTYAPQIKPKIRWRMQKTPTGEKIGLDIEILNAARDKETRSTPVGLDEQWELFKPRCRGVIIFKINPIQFQSTRAINFTIDLVKAMINPMVSKFKNMEIMMDEDGDTAMTDDVDLDLSLHGDPMYSSAPVVSSSV